LLDKDKFHTMFREGCRVVADGGLSGVLGFFLKHRHFRVEPHDIMVESDYEAPDCRRGYITQPKPFSESCVESSWTIEGGELLPYEFVDPSLARKLIFVRKDSETLLRLARIVVDFGLNNVVAIGITSRPAFLHLRADETFVEQTDIATSSQIVLPQPRAALEHSIPTRWSLTKYDSSRSSLSCDVACEPIYVCRERSPGHAIERDGHVIVTDKPGCED
jgi:hypothetical protein